MSSDRGRPYLAWSTAEIEGHLWALEKDEGELEAALHELSLRKTQSARDLARKIENLKRTAKQEAGGAGASTLNPEIRRFMKGTLEKLREKLIDISKRNQLIAFKHSERGASFVRVVDELPDALFERLRSQAMTFDPLPNPDEEPADQKTATFKMALEKAQLTDEDYLNGLSGLGEGGHDEEAVQTLQNALIARVRESLGLPKIAAGKKLDIETFARANGFNPSFELPQPDEAGAHLSDNAIRVLYTRDRLEARLRTIYDRYRGHAAELGIHTLQIAFGFVEWREADGEKLAHHAPLLLMPVNLRREVKAGRYVYRLFGEDENLSVNMALQEMLRRNFGVVLPPVSEDDAPEAYFAQIQDLFERSKRDIRLQRFVTIAVLPFPNMAVWTDLDPDCWPGQSILNHGHLQQLLGARGGSPGSSAFPQDYRVEEMSDAEAPPLVLPADVSQHSALIDVSGSKSLALEGPPGTGKSQTIANMIAGALDRGDRVLFVAEKRAALEVVARRLEVLGFEPLMLELHSERATKAQMIESLKQRLNSSSKRASSKLDQTRKDIGQRRDLLKLYRALLRQPVGALERPVNELIWREMSLRAAVSGEADRSLWSAGISGAEAVDALDLLRKREALDAVEATASTIAKTYEDPTTSRWHAVRNAPPQPIGQDQAREGLKTVARLLRDASAQAAKLGGIASVSAPENLGDLRFSALSTYALPSADHCDEKRLRASLASDEAVVTLVKRLRTWRDMVDATSELHGDPHGVDVAAVQAAEKAFETASKQGATLEQVREDLGALEAQLEQLACLSSYAQEVFAKASSKAAPTAARLRAVALAILQIDQADDETLSLRSSALLQDNAAARLAEGQRLTQGLKAQEASVSQFCDLPRVLSAKVEDLDQAALALGQTMFLMRPFSSAYRSAVTLSRNLGAVPKASSAALSRGLADAAAFRRANDAFNQDERFKPLFPAGAWAGIHSDFERGHQLATNLAALAQSLALARVETSTDFLIGEPLRSIRLCAEQTRGAAEALDEFDQLPGTPAELPAAISTLTAQIEVCRAAIAAAERCGLGPAVPVGPPEKLSALLSELQQTAADLAAARSEFAWFGGTAEDPDQLETHVEFAGKVRKCDLPQEVLAALEGSNNPLNMLASLSSWGQQTMQACEAVDAAWRDFCERYEVDEEAFFGAAFDTASLADLAAAVGEAYDDEDGLRLFADYGRYLRVADERGVRWLIDAVADSRRQLSKLADVYELALVRTLLQNMFRTDGSMFERVGGAQLADASNRFIDLDKLLSELEAARIIGDRLRNEVPYGNGSGPRPTWTDLCLVENETSKSKRHIPIRDLVTRAHGALQALKPVWLMSPTSVAQFVPPGTADFDLILIDEASQMTPEMAVGALARGSQVVVVGDPKQLPPTNFFKNKAEAIEDDEEDDGLEIENESILDLAFSRLDHRRRLKWHYRSQHADLIQFSNRQFYDNELVIFPSPITADDFLGVKSHFVGGAYEGRVNAMEAQAVIEALVGLIYARPELTFGVVTMNMQQRELIFQEFERLRTQNKIVADYAQQREGTVDELFIKNLENVQGDERDIILVSTVYGPPPGGGRVPQRFGLFTRKDGHRRLNVLVTRSRMATLLYTSLRPTDVVITENSSQGVRAFREYLAYAEGAAFVDNEEGGTPDSDFEEFVAERIRAHGYQAIPQIGVDGFRIDLGIKHPSFPTGFLAGVECDGATYHSGLSVRDRDRIRQDVLERLGWRIYRIWSTDWFNDPERETTKLIAYLDRLRERAEASAAARQSREPHRPLAPEAALAPAIDAATVEPVETPKELESSTTPLFDRPLETTADIAPRGPSGKRHVVDDIEFYEEMPGFFEVWIDGEARGSVERLTMAISAARVYGSTFQAQKPQFQVTRYWDETVFNSDDIYAAVRRLAANFRESLGVGA